MLRFCNLIVSTTSNVSGLWFVPRYEEYVELERLALFRWCREYCIRTPSVGEKLWCKHNFSCILFTIYVIFESFLFSAISKIGAATAWLDKMSIVSSICSSYIASLSIWCGQEKSGSGKLLSWSDCVICFNDSFHDVEWNLD